jgi:hypothetical protein
VSTGVVTMQLDVIAELIIAVSGWFKVIATLTKAITEQIAAVLKLLLGLRLP